MRIGYSEPVSHATGGIRLPATVRIHNLKVKPSVKIKILLIEQARPANAPKGCVCVGQVISSVLSECDNDGNNNNCGSNNSNNNNKRLKAFQSISPSIFVQSKLAQGQGIRVRSINWPRQLAHSLRPNLANLLAKRRQKAREAKRNKMK